MAKSLRPGPINRGPFVRAPQAPFNPTGPVPAMTIVPPQIDPRVLAGSAVFFFGSLFGAHSNTAMGAEYQFGTHELAIKQAAQVSSVWGSVRTPPAAAASPVARWFESKPQFDPTQVAPQIWEPTPAERGWLTTGIYGEPQFNPTVIQPQVWKSAAAAVAVTTGPVPAYLKTAPQFDPTQVQPVVWPSKLTVTYAVNDWVQTAPQLDPTQIAPVVWASALTPPTVLGPTIPPYVWVSEQIDTTKLQPQPLVWTPSTFSPSAPVVVTTPQAGAGHAKKRHRPRDRDRHRYRIQIEGRVFHADSEEEAVAILRQAEALAEIAASRKADEIVDRALPKAVALGAVKPINIKTPTVDASPEIERQAALTALAIARTYERASMLAEMRLLLALAEEEEEELLLLS